MIPALGGISGVGSKYAAGGLGVMLLTTLAGITAGGWVAGTVEDPANATVEYEPAPHPGANGTLTLGTNTSEVEFNEPPEDPGPGYNLTRRINSAIANVVPDAISDPAGYSLNAMGVGLANAAYFLTASTGDFVASVLVHAPDRVAYGIGTLGFGGAYAVLLGMALYPVASAWRYVR